jgi:hypothetical protein
VNSPLGCVEFTTLGYIIHHSTVYNLLLGCIINPSVSHFTTAQDPLNPPRGDAPHPELGHKARRRGRRRR